MRIRIIAAFGLAVPLALAGTSADAGLDKLHKQAAEGGRRCMTKHQHFISSGFWPTKSKAMETAARRWENYTSNEYGRDWGSLSRAAAVNWKCMTAKSHRGEQWSCELVARPCR